MASSRDSAPPPPPADMFWSADPQAIDCSHTQHCCSSNSAAPCEPVGLGGRQVCIQDTHLRDGGAGQLLAGVQPQGGLMRRRGSLRRVRGGARKLRHRRRRAEAAGANGCAGAGAMCGRAGRCIPWRSCRHQDLQQDTKRIVDSHCSSGVYERGMSCETNFCAHQPTTGRQPGKLLGSAANISTTCTKPPSLLCAAGLFGSGGLPVSPPLATLLPLAAPCMPSAVV